jgi:Transposase IS116/IS110/IS902 family/CHC2 zinc finger
VRQGTRLVNQVHLLLARSFPERALVTPDLAAGWVRELLDRYPTAAKLAAARPASLPAIPYLPEAKTPLLQAHARASVASVTGPLAEDLIRDQAREVRQGRRRQKRLENLLVAAYRAVPTANHLDTIKGIGEVTAAVLTAPIVAIERFATPGQLVAYFGTFPVEESSGIDRDGRRRAPKRRVMCPRGCDLVRRYLWTAALSAAQHNPAVRPLYQRVRAKHPDHPAIAVGHAMRKLLHSVYAIGTSGQPFDPQHYPWDRAAHVPPAGAGDGSAAGHNPAVVPGRSVVTAADPNAHPTTPTAPEQVAPAPGPTACPADARAAPPVPGAAGASPWLDFAHLRSQLPLERVLGHLGLLTGLRGRGPQRRGPCPLHGAGRGQTFSVHLGRNVFRCFDAACGRQGDVIDLWAALHHVPLRDAALALVRTFALEPAPPTPGTEKRHG